MLVQLTTSRASVRGFWGEGEIVDIPPKEARRLISDGAAIPVRKKPAETTSGATRRRISKETT